MIPIAVAFTPDYFVPAVTMLHSLFRHSNRNREYMVYCLESQEIPKRQKDKLENLFSGTAKFIFIKVNTLPPGTSISKRYSAAALYRLLLPDLLPQLDRILYLDCDIIIRRDISSLFESVQLDGNLLAAVHEPPIENQASAWKGLGIDPDLYFNSGFLILNLELMRREQSVQAIFRLLQDDSLEFPDQDALNIVCRHRVLYLPPYYNAIRTFFIDRYNPEFLSFYSDNDLLQVRESGNIHYTGGKPWRMYSVMFEQWWNEYRMLPPEIKAEWKPKPALRLLAALSSTAPGRSALNFSRQIKSRLS